MIDFLPVTHGNVPTPAVVCYAADRNELRSRVIQWLQTEVVPDGWFVKGSNFSDILLKYFKVGFFSLLGCRKTNERWSQLKHKIAPTPVFLQNSSSTRASSNLPDPQSRLRLCIIIHVTDLSSVSADGSNSV